jgi:hypothetical protein
MSIMQCKKCGDELESTIIINTNELSLSYYSSWKEFQNSQSWSTHPICFRCWCRIRDRDDLSNLQTTKPYIETVIETAIVLFINERKKKKLDTTIADIIDYFNIMGDTISNSVANLVKSKRIFEDTSGMRVCYNTDEAEVYKRSRVHIEDLRREQCLKN